MYIQFAQFEFVASVLVCCVAHVAPFAKLRGNVAVHACAFCEAAKVLAAVLARCVLNAKRNAIVVKVLNCHKSNGLQAISFRNVLHSRSTFAVEYFSP